MKAKELHELIVNSGISQASIARHIKVCRTDLNVALKTDKDTPALNRIRKEAEKYIRSIVKVNRINAEEGC